MANTEGNSLGFGGALLGAIPFFGSALQSWMNAKQQRENVDRTIAANKELAQYQYSKDLEMWNRGNAYNSPMAQMERLRAAGLNPNMVYGSGAPTGATAQTLPKFNAPTVNYDYAPPIDIPSMIGQFQDFRLRSAQIRAQDLAYQKETYGVEGAGFGGSPVGEARPAWQLMVENQLNKLGFGWRNLSADYQLKEQRYKEGLPRYQAEFMAANTRKAQLEQDRIIQATRNLDLQNEYFAAKAITGLFGGAVGAFGKLGAMFKSGGKASGALQPGTLGSYRNTMRFYRPERNPRNQWKGRYGDWFGYE